MNPGPELSEEQKALIRILVRGRELAHAAVDVCQGDYANLPVEARHEFWEELIRMATARLPPKPPIVPATARREMLPAERRAFEQQIVPYEAYRGKTVGEVMRSVEGHSYLCRIADFRFIDQLRLYLAIPEVAQRLPFPDDDGEAEDGET